MLAPPPRALLSLTAPRRRLALQPAADGGVPARADAQGGACPARAASRPLRRRADQPCPAPGGCHLSLPRLLFYPHWRKVLADHERGAVTRALRVRSPPSRRPGVGGCSALRQPLRHTVQPLDGRAARGVQCDDANPEKGHGAANLRLLRHRQHVPQPPAHGPLPLRLPAARRHILRVAEPGHVRADALCAAVQPDHRRDIHQHQRHHLPLRPGRLVLLQRLLRHPALRVRCGNPHSLPPSHPSCAATPPRWW